MEHKCKQCGLIFTRPNHLAVHKRVHTGEMPFECNACGKHFTRLWNMQRHQKGHRKAGEEEEEEEVEKDQREEEDEGGEGDKGSKRTSQPEQAEAALKAEDEEIKQVTVGVTTKASAKRRNRLLLEETEESLSSRSDRQPEEFTTLLKEKDDRIAQLLEEGKKLSKQQLESNNVIKKLRSKEKENDALVKKISKLLEDATSENKKLTEILQVKEETERKQADAITKLNAYVEKQEAQITKLKSELKDSAKKIRSMQTALDNTHKQLADLRKENASKDGGVQKAALGAEMTAEKLRITVSVPMSGREGLQLATQKEEVKVKNEIEELEFQFSDLQTGLRLCEQQAGRRQDYLPQEISDLQQKLQEAKAFKQELTESVTYDEARSHELVEAQEKERVACVARSREAARYKTRYQIRKIKD